MMSIERQDFIMPSIADYDQYYNPAKNRWHPLCEGRQRIWSYLHKCTPENPEGKMYRGIEKYQSDIADACRVDRSLVNRFLLSLAQCGYIKSESNFWAGQRMGNTYSILKPLVVRKDPYWDDITIIGVGYTH